ncbi:restriction endonuclease subunit S [Planosporangium thailandense]|uniref:Restriction endonuclease subunit S n=1 Tax=Planosporangium thailandense TaxID=765197 RepID=A0ABX0XYU4_9ACTN|nr:restriction endonuclease subunit S [Planosporangium thailandense]NJC71236.1 restriction endonuclease subunit S [Planosporangium thailandense]
MNWPVVRLGSVVDTLVPQRDKPDPLTGSIPWVRIEDFDGRYLSGSKSGQGVTQEQVRRMNLRVFPPGTVLCSCSCSMGATAIARVPLVSNQTFIGLVPRNEIDSRFLYYLMGSMRDELQSQATGAIQQYLSRDDFRSLLIPLPTLDEQRRVAEFLDAETARIDALKAARMRMRGLLLLRRERVIERALGLDVDDQEFVPMKHLVQSVTVGIVITPAAWYVEEGGIPALRGVNVKPGRIVTEDLIKISAEGHAAHRKSQLRGGDLVVVRTGQAGTAAVVPQELDGANCIDLVIIRPGPSLFPRFAEYLLNSDYSKRRVAEHSVGSIQSHFNVAAMKLMPVPKRSVEDQIRIAAEIDESVSPIDEVVLRMVKQERLLDERRQALITAAVTGQFDVTTARGVAA